MELDNDLYMCRLEEKMKQRRKEREEQEKKVTDHSVFGD